MLFKIIILLIGFGILYGTGWNLSFGLDINTMLTKIIENSGTENIFKNMGAAILAKSTYAPDYLFSGDFAVINFNNLFYGFYNTHRFFYSTMVEWAGLGAGIYTLWMGITSSFKEEI